MKFFQKKIIWKIFVLFILINNIYSLIVIPFKTIPKKKSDSPFDVSNPVYSNLSIGEKEHSIDVFYTSDLEYYSLDEEICKGDNFYYKNSSLINITNADIIDLEDNQRAVSINETFYFYTDLELKKRIKVENFPILIQLNQINSQKLCILIGLLFRLSPIIKIINFIEILKQFKLTETYVWTIKYTSEYEGLLIIGNEPHVYDPTHYNSSHLRKVSPTITTNSYSWTITFNKIYSGNNVIDENIFCLISQRNSYILGSKDYNKSITVDFFGQYLSNSRCFYHYSGYSAGYYYCDKKSFSKNDITKFPDLIFHNVNLEEKFIFKGEDLFFEDEKYFYFKVYFNEFSQGSWVIGKTFLKKYQLIFDNDNKLIEYYVINITNSIDEKGEQSNGENGANPRARNNEKKLLVYVIILIIVFVIIVGVTIILIHLYGKKICCHRHRKKLVNELLEEDYANINET